MASGFKSVHFVLSRRHDRNWLLGHRRKPCLCHERQRGPREIGSNIRSLHRKGRCLGYFGTPPFLFIDRKNHAVRKIRHQSTFDCSKGKIMENININESQLSKKNPAVSVIVPAYNTEKYIAECLDSVLSQTFQDYEIICIDDGSSDNSLSLFKEYAKRDPRIKVMAQKNQGVVAARNNAIAAAQGEYIFPLDSDDMITPDCLEILYTFITTNNYAVVCPNVQFFGNLKKGKFYRDLPKPTKFSMYAKGAGLINSSMYPKKFWEKYRGYDHLFDKGWEDYDFFLNFFDEGQKIIRLPDRLFYYRQKSTDESRSLQTNKRHGFKKTHDDLFSSLCHKHPKIVKYRYLYKIINPLHKIFRFFYSRGISEHGFIIRICKITVYRRRAT